MAIERPRGALIETLLERRLHVYSLNPKQLDRFRDRHTVAGAKDDRLDAYVLADALRTDRHRFRQVELDHSLAFQIRELSRAHEDLREEINRLTNRLRDRVHRCAPHLLQLCPAADQPWFWDLIERTVGPQPWIHPQRRAVQQLLKRHHIRRFDADDVLAVLLREPPMTLAPRAPEAARTSACSCLASRSYTSSASAASSSSKRSWTRSPRSTTTTTGAATSRS